MAKPTQCRDRRDEIADMVKLDGEDPSNLLAGDQRVTRVNQLERLGIGRKIITLPGQRWVIKRVPRRQLVSPTLVERGRVEIIGNRGTAGEFVVDQRRKGCVDDPPAAGTGAQAEIDVVIDDVVSLIKPAEGIELAAAYQEASAGNRNDIARRQRQAKIAEIVFGGEAERMSPAARHPKYAGVLDFAVGIEQTSANDTNFGLLGIFKQRVEPPWFDNFHVIVEKQQKLATRSLSREVIEARPVELFGGLDDLVGIQP